MHGNIPSKTTKIAKEYINSEVVEKIKTRKEKDVKYLIIYIFQKGEQRSIENEKLQTKK